MIYPGMARLVPGPSARPPPRAGPPTGSVVPLIATGPVPPLPVTSASTRRVSPNAMQAVFSNGAPARALHRRPVPAAGSPRSIQQHVATPLPARRTAPSSSVARNGASAVLPTKGSFQIGELGDAADNFRASDINIVKVFAEALVFIGLVLLKWAGSLSKPQQVSAVIKTGLVAIFFALHPAYAIVTTVVVFATYLYEKIHVTKSN